MHANCCWIWPSVKRSTSLHVQGLLSSSMRYEFVSCPWRHRKWCNLINCRQRQRAIDRRQINCTKFQTNDCRCWAVRSSGQKSIQIWWWRFKCQTEVEILWHREEERENEYVNFHEAQFNLLCFREAVAIKANTIKFNSIRLNANEVVAVVDVVVDVSHAFPSIRKEPISIFP